MIKSLGLQPSDILQTNGIIWVEGPSDRIYIKKWLKLVNPKLRENVHYQFLYYGGRLLSHLSTEEEANDLINVLGICRNSAIIMDSDKSKETDDINETKKRVLKQFSENGLFCLATEGREIENYIPNSILRDLSGKDDVLNEKFGEINQMARAIFRLPDDTEIKTFDKIKFANEIKEKITIKNMNEQGLNLLSNIQTLAEDISEWNKN